MGDQVEARQVDREAAAAFLEWYGGTDKPTLDRIRAGERDDFIPVLTFASHGASARKAALEEAAGVAEEYANAAPVEQLSGEVGGPFVVVCKLLAESIAAAIRNLASAQGEE